MIVKRIRAAWRRWFRISGSRPSDLPLWHQEQPKPVQDDNKRFLAEAMIVASSRKPPSAHLSPQEIQGMSMAEYARHRQEVLKMMRGDAGAPPKGDLQRALEEKWLQEFAAGVDFRGGDPADIDKYYDKRRR